MLIDDIDYVMFPSPRSGGHAPVHGWGHSVTPESNLAASQSSASRLATRKPIPTKAASPAGDVGERRVAIAAHVDAITPLREVEQAEVEASPMRPSAIEASMKRQVLKTILFALSKALNLTASRVPAFRERLMQRDVVAWIGLQDGSVGRIVEIRSGRFRSSPGAAAQAEISMAFKDAATALKFLLPNRDQSEIVHAAKNFKVVTTGPDETLVWFTRTLNMSNKRNRRSETMTRKAAKLVSLKPYDRRRQQDVTS